MPKTNDSVEGWHTGFKWTVEATHAINIFKFIKALHREQVLADAQYEKEILSGEPLVKRKKEYRDNIDRL